jgi:hypothetical protein
MGPDTEVAPATPTPGADLIQAVHLAYGPVAALPSFLSDQVSGSPATASNGAPCGPFARNRDFARPLTGRPLARDRRLSGRTGRRVTPGAPNGQDLGQMSAARSMAADTGPAAGGSVACRGLAFRPVLDPSVKSVQRFAPNRGG